MSQRASFGQPFTFGHRAGRGLGMAATLASLAALAALASCGGGGSGGSSGSGGSTTPTTLTLTGVVASGQAMAGAAVSVKCTGGSATATTSSTGAYSASISGGSLPCMARATSSDGTKVYHSALNAGATSTVINITPLTELILALAIGDPSQVDATFANNTTLPSAVASQLATAKTALATALAGAGISIGSIDPVSTALTASTSTSAPGDSQDQAIDTVMANLAANGSGLLELAAALTSPVTTAQGQQQADALLAAAPAVSQCPSARAGTYWWVNHNGSLATIALNSALTSVTITATSGSTSETDALTWGAGCQASFTQQDTSVQQVTFASGGEFAAGNASNANVSSSFHIAIPQQKVALADLAGNWNSIEYDSRENTGTNASETSVNTLTIDAQGHLTCTAAEVAIGCTNPTLTPNADGSFTATGSGGNTTPVLVFRGANGALNFIALQDYPNGGGLIFGAQAATLSLPASGTSTTYVQYQFSGIPATGSTANWGKFDIDTFTYTVSAVDTANDALTRTYSTEDGAAYDLVDVVDYNQPSTGFRTRPALSFTDSAGTTYNKQTSYNLSLGTGMSVFADGVSGGVEGVLSTSTSAPFFGLSITLH